MTDGLRRAGTALALVGLFAGGASAQLDDAEAAVPEVRHSRAPVDVSLVITERVRVISPGEDFVLALSEAEPGRFSEDDGGWLVDSQGEFEWDDDEEIYWQWLEPDVLTRGRQDFVQFCASCHGLEGDGYGRSAQGLRPPPRDFRQGMFKFSKVNPEYLPNDEVLVNLIKNGLDGTPMYPWAVSDQRLNDIVQYIKSLSLDESPPQRATAWKDAVSEVAGVIETEPDPWVGRESEAIEAGEAAYHNLQCYSCHPAYVSTPRINEIRGVDASTTYREGLTYPKVVRDTAYEVLGYPVSILPPDFTWHTTRSGRTVNDVFLTIYAGIPGAGMPTWSGGSTPDAELWAIAYYVRDLIDEYKDQPAKRTALMGGLRNGN